MNIEDWSEVRNNATGMATRWGLKGVGEFFRTLRDRPLGPLLYYGYCICFPGGGGGVAPGRGLGQPPALRCGLFGLSGGGGGLSDRAEALTTYPYLAPRLKKK